MKIVKHLNLEAESMASLLLRACSSPSRDWKQINAQIEGLGSGTQLVRDQVAEGLRNLRTRLAAGEKLLCELDRKLAEHDQMDFP